MKNAKSIPQQMVERISPCLSITTNGAECARFVRSACVELEDLPGLEVHPAEHELRIIIRGLRKSVRIEAGAAQNQVYALTALDSLREIAGVE